MKRPIPAACALGVVLFASACQPTARSEQATAFTTESMQKLRWLEGAWRDAGGGTPYYEVYRFENDSSIRMTYYTDSALTEARDSGRIYLEAGTIYHLAARDRWRAIEVDSAAIVFEAVTEAGRRFTWRRESPSVWLATLESRSGSPLVFRLERVAAAR